MTWARMLLTALPFALLALAYPGVRDLPRVATLESDTLTWRFGLRGPQVPDAPVTIVAIDDATVAATGGWPVPRDRLGTAIRRLSQAGAAVIAVDLLMAEPSRTPGADAALAQAMRAGGRTVLPVAGTLPRAARSSAPVELSGHTVPLRRAASAPPPPRPTALLTPIRPLAEASAGLGHVNVVLGPDGALTGLHPALLLPEAGALPSLALLAAARFQGVDRRELAVDLPRAVQLGAQRVPLARDGRWTANFYGPGGSFPTIPLIDVLRGTFNLADVDGRVIWLGATATSAGDTFVTPFDPAMPGVEAFATVTANLLTGGFLAHGPWATLAEMAAVFAVGVLSWHAARLRPAWLAVGAALVPAAAWLAVASAAFVVAQVWLNVTVPVLAGVIGGTAAVGGQLVLGDRQRRRLAHYVPQPLAEALASTDRPAFEGLVLPAAVMFVDMVGFTARSETASPEDTVDTMRRLHAELEAAAAHHGGYVDNFAGDGAMLVFGVPQPRGDDAARALACARALLACTARQDLPVRIGLHFGPVQVARLGGRQQHQLTLAGDVVNLASRLMAVAKDRGVGLAVSAATIKQGPETGSADLAGMAYSAAVPIRGRQAPVDLWLGPDPAEAPTTGPGSDRTRGRPPR